MQIKKWTLKYGDYDPIPCEPPCSLYSVLVQNGIIWDPFYGLNTATYQKLSDEDCDFYGTFEVDALSCHNVLVLSGIDTLCTVYLNGKKIGSMQNMHRTFRFEVGRYLQLGRNTLHLAISSPTRYFAEMENRHHLFMDPNALPGASHLRKGLWMSGWDWGPRLPDMGILGEVSLQQYAYDRIEDFAIRQTHKQGRVKLSFSASTRHDSERCTLRVRFGDRIIPLEEGCGETEVENPRLWWPRGYGEQPLYPVTLELARDGDVIDSVTKHIGLRTLTVSTAADQYGNEFCFVVNGVKIFAMGANYIPQDSLVSRVTHEKIDRLIDACCDANYNCVRIWGGGYYPSDYFYDRCDSVGLLVWQDMMVACANIWLTEEMRENLTAEFTEQIKRLRHHASLGLLCGNNEMEDAVITWEAANGSYAAKMDYLELYERILPGLCGKYAPDTFYWPSSPSSGGGFDDPGSDSRGDQHYWTVWHGNLPFEEYRNHKFRFCSEYGFESFPSMKTIESFCQPEDHNIFSRIMEFHQKCLGGNKKILNYIADHYLYPSGFRNLVYASQLNQAEAIRYGVEHFRRNRGCCMGSIYWQLNDCWPVASWSSIDYFGRYKALHYAARKFYAPVACGLFRENGTVAINVSNEQMQQFRGSLYLFFADADMNKFYEETVEIQVPAMSSRDVFWVDEMHVTDIYSNYLCVELRDLEGRTVVTQTQLFAEPKHFQWQDPRIKAEVCAVENGVEIQLTAEHFAKSVSLDFTSADIVLSDNFFDITCHSGIRVFGKTELSAQTIAEQLCICSVYDIDK